MPVTPSSLLSLVCLLSLMLSLCSSVGQAEIQTREQLFEARKAAAQQPRRLIFNNDGNEPVYLCTDNTPEGLLNSRTAPLADSQVDAIFYCTWSSGFGMFTHNTQVGHVFATKEDLFHKNRITEMLAAGTDPLAVMVEFCKDHQKEIFWSLRMNDTHDAGLSGYGPVMFRANPLKQKHPEWLIGTPTDRPKFGGWSAVDFTRPEIRDLAVGFFEEVCQNYDIDGIELDFFRHPVFFKRAAQEGVPCSEEELGLMTEMITRMREIADQEGLKRGRPILISVRVPDSVEYSRTVGLDLEHWLSHDLIDLLMVSGYFQLNPWETSVAVGQKYGVPVYASLDEPRIREPSAQKLRRTPAAYRGRTLNALQAGMAGVSLFNSFNPRSPMWQELGSREKLETMDQDYFASIRGVGAAAGGAYPHREFQQAATLNPKHPLKLTPGKSTSVDLYFGCDYRQLPKESAPQLTLRLQFNRQPATAEKKEAEKSLTVLLNGEKLSEPKLNENWLEFSLQPDQLSPGRNQVEVQLPAQAPAISWTDLHATVRWPAQ